MFTFYFVRDSDVEKNKRRKKEFLFNTCMSVDGESRRNK